MLRFIKHRITTLSPSALMPALGVCVVLYFAYHMIQGDHGIRALLDYQYRINLAQAELEAIRQKRMKLEHRVSLLRSDNLDPDLLEERARIVLGYSHKNEIALLVSFP